ncbi:MAG: hypothetical protein M3N21_05590 [Actinomycetota bacterium]|nr:hypothetical protein [Actinomycetota bacterium]
MSDPHGHVPADSGPPAARVLVYSSDPAVRYTVRTAVGRRPAADLGPVEWLECTTGAEFLTAVDAGGVDVAILDGEAWPTGGLGLAKQIKDELVDCPHTLVLVGRADDAWLARWSLADAVLTHPVDPRALADAAASALRARSARLPVRRAAG